LTTTLLAVDDSKTLRKVFEITFAGEPGFQVVLAESAQDALSKLGSVAPVIALVDVTLPDQNGYDLCGQIKARSPQTSVIVLGSKQIPYDAARGEAAGADDYIDKPFDTQQLIDKVNRLATGVVAPAPAPAVAPAVHSNVAAAMNLPKSSHVSAAPPVQLRGPSAAPAPARRMTSTPPPKPKSALPAVPAASAAVAHAASGAAGAGISAEQLAGLGLSAAQVEAVMALSRDVVERVVWEVVPVLAETLIKEEIRRLTAE